MKRIQPIPGKKPDLRNLNYVIEETQSTHHAELYKIEELPNGEFKEIHIGGNLVLLGGLRELMYLLYNKRPSFSKPTFEEALYKTANEDLRHLITPKTEGRTLPWVQGFNIALDGTVGSGVIKYPKHRDGLDFSTMVPFRVIPVTENDFSLFKPFYLHHRVVTIEGREYVEYYTKKCDITINALFKDGSPVPDNPDLLVDTDLDSRIVAEFTVDLTRDELVEHFRLRTEIGAEGAMYNSTSLVIGSPADITLDGTVYDTLTDSHLYTKSNHIPLPHGESATLRVKYKNNHI